MVMPSEIPHPMKIFMVIWQADYEQIRKGKVIFLFWKFITLFDRCNEVDFFEVFRNKFNICIVPIICIVCALKIGNSPSRQNSQLHLIFPFLV